MTRETLWFETALLPEGWEKQVRLTLDSGVITEVETGVQPQPEDERHAVGLPGMGNVHSHAFQHAMAGLTEVRGPGHDSFWTWREMMYRFVDQMTPEDVEVVATQLYIEMLEAGYTRVGEFHYLHNAPDGSEYGNIAELSARIAAAAETSGIGLTLLPVFYAHGSFGGQEPSHGQRRFLNSVSSYERLHQGAADVLKSLPDAVLGIAPHSLRAATFEEIEALLPLASDKNPIHIHIAEQIKEVNDCLQWSGKRPVELLYEKATPDTRWCLIHATHVTEAERQIIARSGAVVGLCPLTEANLGDGIFPARAYLEDGGKFAIGSDSNIEITIRGELKLLEYSQRLTERGRSVLTLAEGQSTGRTLFDHAHTGGMQVLGCSTRGLADGETADIFSLSSNATTLAARSGDALLDGWVFSGGRAVTDCVWRRGRKVVSNGRHHLRDSSDAHYKAFLKRILQ